MRFRPLDQDLEESAPADRKKFTAGMNNNFLQRLPRSFLLRFYRSKVAGVWVRSRVGLSCQRPWLGSGPVAPSRASAGERSRATARKSSTPPRAFLCFHLLGRCMVATG